MIDGLDLEALRNKSYLAHDIGYSRAYNARLQQLSVEADKLRTETLMVERKQRLIGRFRNRRYQNGVIDIFAQSDIGTIHEAVSPPIDTNQNVEEINAEATISDSAGVSAVVNPNGQLTQYPISEFLSRPTFIYSEVYQVGTRIIGTFNPWDLWSKDQSIRAKLNNYAYFRGTMNLKFSISGSPYDYGKLLFSYYPYHLTNDVLAAYEAMFAANSEYGRCWMTYLSQAEGSMTMDVNNNEPYVMSLPFVSYKSQFRLYNKDATVIGATTSFSDFAEAGAIYGGCLNTIRNSQNDTASTVVLNVYAWVTDIELGSTTGTDIDIVAQSKSKRGKTTRKGNMSFTGIKNFVDSKVNDEYDDSGPLSSVASAFSGAAGSLTKVPIIGPWAVATQQAATTLGKIASFFGFSKPPVLTNAIYVKNNPFQNASTTIGHQTVDKLTVDPKQELTIDNTICGSSYADDMALAVIASRESYFTTFKWNTAQVEMVDRVWECAVTPVLCNGKNKVAGVTDETDRFIQPTAMAFAALPFGFWRGSITYRFEIVCSKFHRGKLLIKYEPNLAQYTLLSSGTSRLNQQNCFVVDIQETTEFEITIDWASSKSWLPVHPTVSSNPELDVYAANLVSYNENTDIPGYVLNSIETKNGFIQVLPFTQLLAPDTAQNVLVNVYVHSKDLELARPVSNAMDLSRSYVAQSAVINPTNASPGAGAELLYMGEDIVSFRQLLKRYQGHIQYDDTAATATSVDKTGFFNPWPSARNYIGSNVAPDTAYLVGDLKNYLHYAYLGWRGGVRLRVRWSNANMEPNVSVLQNNLTTGPTSAINIYTGDTYFCRWTGSTMYYLDNNAGVEFEYPFQTDMLFLPFGIRRPAALTSTDPFGFRAWMTGEAAVVCQYAARQTTVGGVSWIIDWSTAEDFTLQRFQGAPFCSVQASI